MIEMGGSSWRSSNSSCLPILSSAHACITRSFSMGVAPIEKLLVMQAWAEDKIGKHDELLDLQLDPPISIIGLANVDGEKAKLLRQKGGTFAMPFAPGAEIKRL